MMKHLLAEELATLRSCQMRLLPSRNEIVVTETSRESTVALPRRFRARMVKGNVSREAVDIARDQAMYLYDHGMLMPIEGESEDDAVKSDATEDDT